MRQSPFRLDGVRRCTVVLAVAASLTVLPASARDVVVHAGHLLDGGSDSPQDKVSILIRDVGSGQFAGPALRRAIAENKAIDEIYQTATHHPERLPSTVPPES